MKNSFLHTALEKEIAICSIYLTIAFLYGLFGQVDFSLIAVPNIYISQATLDGVDISARVNYFYKIILTAFLILPLCYFLLHRAKVFFNIKTDTLQLPAILATAGIFLILSNILGINSQEGSLLFFYLFIIAAAFAFLKKKKYLALFPPLLTISLLLFSAVLFLFNSNTQVNTHGTYVFLFIFLISLLSFGILRQFRFNHRKVFTFLVPLSLVPILFFISIEAAFFFKIKYDFFIAYKWLFIGLLGLGFAFSTGYILQKKPSRSRFNLFVRFFVPAAMLSSFLLVLYQPFLEQAQELFELANPANAQMRMFKFGEIPFVDFMSSHMFSEQFYGILHHFIFGYQGDLSFLSYRFLYHLCFLGIAYYFLFRLFKNPFLALLFLLLIPFPSRFFYRSVFFVMPVFFVIRQLMFKQSLGQYLWLFLLVVFLIVWQLDTGSAALFTTVIFLPISFFITGKKINFKAIFAALGIVLGGIGLLLLLFSLLRSPEYMLTNFKTALHYVTANQAHGYSLLSKAPNQHFFLFFAILPTFSILASLYIIYLLKHHALQLSMGRQFTLQASLFLFILYIANFQRGLVRHHFMEHNDSFVTGSFYIAAALFLLGIINTKRPSQKFIAFFTFSFFLLIFVKYFSVSQDKSFTEKVLTANTFYQLDHYFNETNFKGKIIPNEAFAAQNYTDLKHFLDENLSPEQTFLDFSNTPMLYYYCQREVPSYFCQNLQNTVDEYLQTQHLAALNPEKVPMVIYSNYPTTWWDKTDGVPNSMRQYLMAEYIYKNYKPFAVINKHSIWISKTKKMQNADYQVDKLIEVPQIYQYKKAAAAINTYYEKVNDSLFTSLGKGTIFFDDNQSITSFKIDKNMALSSHLLLKVFINTPWQGKTCTIEILDKENELIGRTNFTCLAEQKAYMVHLSNHYLWHTKTPALLKIIKEGKPVKKVAFYKNSRNEDQ